MARLVVVDPDVDRRHGIEEELARLGHEIVQAPSGAFALTMLDRARVELIVSASAIGDMDGCELCEILRSDPQHTGLLFVLLGAAGGPRPWAAAKAGVDEVLPAGWTMPELVSRVDFLLKRSARGRAAAVPGRPRAARSAAQQRALEGSLGVMDLPEIAQAIAFGGKSGRLEVTLASAEGVIVFDAGRVAHAEFGPASGERAFAALVWAACRERGGTFRFALAEGPRGPAAKRTIGKGVDELLLSAASAIDEGRADNRGEEPLGGPRPVREGA